MKGKRKLNTTELPPHLHKHNSLNKHGLLGEDTVTKTIEKCTTFNIPTEAEM